MDQHLLLCHGPLRGMPVAWRRLGALLAFHRGEDRTESRGMVALLAVPGESLLELVPLPACLCECTPGVVSSRARPGCGSTPSLVVGLTRPPAPHGVGGSHLPAGLGVDLRILPGTQRVWHPIASLRRDAP